MNIVARPWTPQDLIDDLQQIIDEESDRYLNTRRTTMCMARDYLKEHFSESGWISVSDRLPNDTEKVLVYTTTGNTTVARWSKRQEKFVASGHITVTHWMALPEKPEVGG